jgi:hypothetical protein
VAADSSIQKGTSTALDWTTDHATTFTITPIGSVTPVDQGSKSVSPTVTTTYTGTATGPGGTSKPCVTTVTVTVAPPVLAVSCSGAPANGNIGDTFTWSADPSGGTAPYIYKWSGDETLAGTAKTEPKAYTTVGTKDANVIVTSADGQQKTATCSVIVEHQVPGSPSCTLTASPTAVNAGDHTVLSWTTKNPGTFSIDQGVGAVSPALMGTTTSKAINADTTFTGTVTSPSGKVATCTAPVTVIMPGEPTCSLNVSPSSIPVGNLATVSWGGTEITNVDIDNGIATATSSPGSAIVSPGVGGYTYNGTFHANNGSTLSCSATLTVTGGGGGGGGGGCTGNCGGGGGGGSPSPTILLAALPHINAQPLAYLYLSQIPYTGLDLGPVGTALYWLALIGWSLALAYLVLFVTLPLAVRRIGHFGTRVATVVNTRQDAAATPMPQPAPIAAPVPAPVRMSAPAPVEQASVAPAATSRGYSTYDGFKSFAQEGALSIDDIVKGLSRNAEPAREHIEPMFQDVELAPAEAAPRPQIVPEVSYSAKASPIAAPLASSEVKKIDPSVRGFIVALVERDRVAVFGALRLHLRGGGDAEILLTEATCALDDAYRARIDGIACDPAIAKVCEKCDNATLEKLVAALTTAIDSSYSEGVTGAKLALTRALATLGT